jgi:hypothetical protein
MMGVDGQQWELLRESAADQSVQLIFGIVVQVASCFEIAVDADTIAVPTRPNV